MTDEYTKLKVDLFVGCVTWIREKNEGKFGKAISSCLIKRKHLQGSYLLCFEKNEGKFGKAITSCLIKREQFCKALTCFALLCSSLEFTIINIYQIKVFVYHS